MHRTPKQITDWQVDESSLIGGRGPSSGRDPAEVCYLPRRHDAALIDGDGETFREDDALMKTNKPCKGTGKSWSVNKEGKPICPGCHRAFSTVAGYGKAVRDIQIVPLHDRIGSQNARFPERRSRD